MGDNSRRRAAAWDDPRSWSLYGTVYHAPLDDRIIVPKRRTYLGWTLNFAHPEAYGLVIGGTAAVALCAYALRRGGRQ